MTQTDMRRIQVPRPWWKRRGTLLAASAVVVVALAATAVYGIRAASRTCADGVQKLGEHRECVGITDGAYSFAPELDDVTTRIKQENDQTVASGKPYVSVAVFVPMTLVDQPTTPISWVQHHLQGAYTAQLRANHGPGNGNLPLVRLLLANPGSRMAQWDPVVDEIIRRKTTPDRVVAVAGIGLSLENARLAMRKLSTAKITVVGSTITADDLATIPGLLRAAPPNKGQARAAANYIKASATKALLVKDISEQDRYSATLAEAFTATFPDTAHELVGQPELYDSSLAGVENTFLQMMPNICASKADVVYFAGRGIHLSSFVKQLTGRRCAGQPITVLTGDDVSVVGFQEGDVRRAIDSGVRVVFTTLAHPEAWKQTSGKFEEPSVRSFTDTTCDYCYGKYFAKESLDDGSAIMAHDAVLTAAWAIRLASGSKGEHVTAEEVLQEKNRLNTEYAVPGASGWLSFDADGTPRDKAVPIMELNRDGTSKFVQLSFS